MLGASAALAFSTESSDARERSQSRPNVVFIMADDMGYADLSCYGRRDYQTPNIDRLAAQGVRYTQGYSNSPVCSATRTALITGRYQYRFAVGLEEPLTPFRHVGLPADQPTLPTLLKDAGYQTGLVGKWHLGALPDFGPLQSGYERFFGYRGGGVDYFTHNGPGGPDLWDGDSQVEFDGYLTDILADRAIGMLEAFADERRPFFLSVHFNAPHWPWEGPEDLPESERLSAARSPNALFHWDGGSAATYASIVTRLDYQVGRIMRALNRLRISQNTIVVFTSDNGGERYSDTWPFSGKKTELLEGGIRVPCIVRWPQRLPPSTNTKDVTISMDWAPTLAQACGVQATSECNFDGVDIFNQAGADTLAERILFWRYTHANQQACRSGRWKYLCINENCFLFDLEADPLERANLKDRHPEVFARLTERYRIWSEQMLHVTGDVFTHGFLPSELAERYQED